MVVHDQHRDREKRRRRVIRQHPSQPDQPTRDPGEGADLQQHVLVQDAPPSGLVRHAQDVRADHEHRGQGQRPGGEAGHRFAQYS